MLFWNSKCVKNKWEKFEDTKVVMISCNSKKDRQYNGQKNKRLKFNKCSTKLFAIRTLLKTSCELNRMTQKGNLSITPAFPLNYITGRRQITKIKVNRWFFRKKIYVKKQFEHCLCLYASCSCMNTGNHLGMMIIICWQYACAN
jgi:hypothetical protein